ncbi:MAG: hypothetical protein KAJ53_07680 [Anaerolineales bacterium]|nr:hypothetical protein [Anaerolineales bacterium]
MEWLSELLLPAANPKIRLNLSIYTSTQALLKNASPATSHTLVEEAPANEEFGLKLVQSEKKEVLQHCDPGWRI